VIKNVDLGWMPMGGMIEVQARQWAAKRPQASNTIDARPLRLAVEVPPDFR
jgi:hypothetical protein